MRVQYFTRHETYKHLIIIFFFLKYVSITYRSNLIESNSRGRIEMVSTHVMD